jgi:hypothetical protein
MIIRAIKTRQIKDFLYCVWAFNKNFEYIDLDNDEGSGSNSEERQFEVEVE